MRWTLPASWTEDAGPAGDSNPAGARRWFRIRRLWAWVPLLTLMLAVLLAHGCAPWPAHRPDWDAPLLPPLRAAAHLLGTDAIGRDVLALTAAAAAQSLWIAGCAALVGICGGGVLGVLAGWYGGRFDQAVVALLALAQSLPLLLLAILVMAVADGGWWPMLAVLAGYVMLDVARLARGEVRVLRHQRFIAATTVLGVPEHRVLLRHVLPNLRRHAGLAVLLALPQAVMIESFLGFLGLGAVGASQSLGSLLADGMQDVQIAPWLLLAPATVMVWLLAALAGLAQRLERRP